MKTNHPESILQRQCVRWFRLQYPKLADLLYAIPNGGMRSKTEAAIMKAEGVVPGIPDLFLAVPTKKFHGLYIEMKSQEGKLTEKQCQMTDKLAGQGYDVVICNNFDLFQTIITIYLSEK